MDIKENLRNTNNHKSTNLLQLQKSIYNLLSKKTKNKKTKFIFVTARRCIT
jgi:two-component sensor histidine kinase